MVTVNQLEVVWQASQTSVEAMCVAGLPVAVVPSWQLKQVPMTAVWSIVIVSQLVAT